MRGLIVVSVVVLLGGAGCASEQGPARAAPEQGLEESAGFSVPTDQAPSPQVASLLPVGPDRVRWYRATRPESPPRQVALFRAVDQQVQAPVLRSLGWSRGDAEVRLWAGPEAVWFWPAGLAQTAYRVWTPARKWDEGRGHRYGLEEIQLPGGVVEAVRTERRGGALRVVHWLAPGEGLVRLEVFRGERRVLLLEWVSEAERKVVQAVAAKSPALAWGQIVAAVERLDWQALEPLLSVALIRRLDGPRGAAEVLLGEPTGLPRLRAFLDLGLAVAAGPPLELGESHARLRATSRSGPVVLVFEVRQGGWVWAGLESADDR